MEKENIAVGLDIGTTKIVAMIGKKNEYGKLEILGVGKSKSLGVARGWYCRTTHSQHTTHRLRHQK
jgi:cell division protein FtsA